MAPDEEAPIEETRHGSGAADPPASQPEADEEPSEPDPDDEVDEWGYESFPASDPPQH
jgi:hypothetical protein